MKKREKKRKKASETQGVQFVLTNHFCTGACLGVWLINSLSFHWRKLIFHVFTAIICESVLSMGAILC